MNEAKSQSVQKIRPLALFGTALTGILAGGLLGAFANAVNGWVSPTYFVTIMHWKGFEDVWRASIAQGIFEGLLFGSLYSLIFAVGAGIITRASCSYSFATYHLLGVMAGALVCWALGGIAGVVLAALSPEFYQHSFTGVPEARGDMFAFAWVGGSIWGIQLGGFLCVILGLVVLRGRWRGMHA